MALRGGWITTLTPSPHSGKTQQTPCMQQLVAGLTEPDVARSLEMHTVSVNAVTNWKNFSMARTVTYKVRTQGGSSLDKGKG